MESVAKDARPSFAAPFKVQKILKEALQDLGKGNYKVSQERWHFALRKRPLLLLLLNFLFHVSIDAFVQVIDQFMVELADVSVHNANMRLSKLPDDCKG